MPNAVIFLVNFYQLFLSEIDRISALEGQLEEARKTHFLCRQCIDWVGWWAGHLGTAEYKTFLPDTCLGPVPLSSGSGKTQESVR